MYELAYGFSLNLRRTFYESFVCMDGRPPGVCPLVCMIHKVKLLCVHLSIVAVLESSTVHMRTNQSLFSSFFFFLLFFVT